MKRRSYKGKGNPAYTHGMRGTRIYNIWTCMKSRCNNNYSKKDIYDKITYDNKWGTFEGFYEDMKDGYKDNLTIDRIDNNKGYYKENCRWVDYNTQNKNKRNIRMFTYNGKTQCIKDWCNELNLNYGSVMSRINRDKLPYIQALKLNLA